MAPTTKTTKPAGKDFRFFAGAKTSAPPPAQGSKAVPEGQPNCLAGLAFVFTGELSSLARDEAIDLAKRYGGRVTLQPSSKTSYVVLGDNAGPAKLATIKKHGLKTLDEDQFLNLIATRKSGQIDEKTKKKMEKEEEAIRQAAKEMEKREKAEAKKEKEGEKSQDAASSKTGNLSSQLWTVRYAPQSLKEVCGNKSQVEKLQQWLHDWPSSRKSGFKKPGKSGANVYRAVLITGPPGIGKTTSAHLCARLEGFTPIELNASDARSKKLVESHLNINNTSLNGYFHGKKDTNVLGVPLTDKSCIIMDEVDGMSAGDRGGVGALNALIKKTKIPIICIANDKQAQKMKPLMHTTFNLTFQKPQVNAIRSRILTIVYKEKMKIPANVIDQLITSAQSDIRQVLNMLSTWKLSSDTMNFDESKSLGKMNEKYTIMSPFDITSKVLGPYLFSPTARESLGDKMDMYFQDHQFVPLFIQENYLRSQPARVRDMEGPEKILKQLELMDGAASSISDGDLVDSLIHGPEQHWALMPLHAVCSTIRPASFVYGNGVHYGGPNSMAFPQWLGQNSKQNKLMRQLTDIQIRMRLKVSGDKSEIRQSYIPALYPHLVQPLVEEGASAIEGIIECMDEYYLSKDEWDTIVELVVDEKGGDAIMKKISSSTKAAFTRKYNSTEHPIAFHKAQDLGKVPKKLAAGPMPDLEEAYEADDIVEEASEDEKKGKDVDDISGDKLIQAAKKKKAGNRKGYGLPGATSTANSAGTAPKRRKKAATVNQHAEQQPRYQDCFPSFAEQYDRMPLIQPQELTLRSEEKDRMHIIASANESYMRIHVQRQELEDRVHELERQLNFERERRLAEETHWKDVVNMLTQNRSNSTDATATMQAQLSSKVQQRNEALQMTFPSSFNKSQDVERREADYPNVKYWNRNSFNLHPTATVNGTTPLGPEGFPRRLGFLENENGQPIAIGRLDDMREHLLQSFRDIKKLMPSLFGDGWTRCDKELQKACYTEMRLRFPELILCAKNWKARALLIEWFSNWNKNRTNVEEKSGDEVEDESSGQLKRRLNKKSNVRKRVKTTEAANTVSTDTAMTTSTSASVAWR
ncbi:hypothetical protein AX17_002187 [Amanita inopinata Kibby_2008]|nr:hypothetical protein AX17_002187 [Amanita inopinata Kibby_2008]